MYQPPSFREDRLDIQHALMRSHPLAMLVTMGEGGLSANPVPLMLDASRGTFGVLQGHLARANPQWRGFDAGVECLAIFQGAEHYISPAWYETKRLTGKVVPTWNYAIVQVRGHLSIHEDAAWLRAQVDALTAEHERERPAPWSAADAPADFIAAQLKGIVGIEIAVTRIEGKWKASQNRPAADRDGVVAGLTADGDPAASAMAALIERSAPHER